ncbi:alpha/beta fold hydrolase, partial [Nostoc flagelliforme]|uniref:alpha/beta fold hydrolase n=1 Tax=Nostoc flagelliforme TaxID=1306274 RepID=UPI001F548B9C
KLSVTISKLYDYVFTKISKLALKALNSLALEFSDKSLDRPGNAEIQMALFYDYRTNPQLYPQWQEYFRKHQPPTLIVWGKNDDIFPAEGAYAYQRDLKDVEFHLLNTHIPHWRKMAMRSQTTSVNFSRHDCNPYLPNQCKF